MLRVRGAFVADMEISCKLFMDTKSTAVQGWSLAVAHNEADLNIDDSDAVPVPPMPSANINTIGTDAAATVVSILSRES